MFCHILFWYLNELSHEVGFTCLNQKCCCHSFIPVGENIPDFENLILNQVLWHLCSCKA